MSRYSQFVKGAGADVPVGTIARNKLNMQAEGWLPCDRSLRLVADCPELALKSSLLNPTGDYDFTHDRINGTPTLPNIGLGCAFSPDGQYLAVGHFGAPYLTVIDATDWSVVSGTPALPSNGQSCAFSPDGEYLAVGHNGSPSLTVIDTADWSVVSGTPTLPSNGYACAFSPDGQYLAVGYGGSPNFTVIDTSDWSVVSGTPTLPSLGYGCAFSPDGQYLAVGYGGSPNLSIFPIYDPVPDGYFRMPSVPKTLRGDVLVTPMIRAEN